MVVVTRLVEDRLRAAPASRRFDRATAQIKYLKLNIIIIIYHPPLPVTALIGSGPVRAVKKVGLPNWPGR